MWNCFRRRVIAYAVLIAMIFVIAWYVSAYHYQLMLIQGESMRPAYHNLQLVWLDKTFEESDITDGDVIAFRCEGLNSVLVKRVVACAGDSAIISEGDLYVNGERVDFYDEGIFKYAGVMGQEMVLQRGELLVIGDNVEQSKDSRYPEVGTVDYNEVIGIVEK